MLHVRRKRLPYLLACRRQSENDMPCCLPLLCFALLRVHCERLPHLRACNELRQHIVRFSTRATVHVLDESRRACFDDAAVHRERRRQHTCQQDCRCTISHSGVEVHALRHTLGGGTCQVRTL